MSVTLRLDKDFPLEEWIELYRVSDYNLAWGQRNARAALAYAYLVTTAWLDGRAVGTLTVWSDGVNFALLDDLVVHPGYRRRNIGSRLVTETLVRLASDGISAVQVLPIPGREPFFAGLGFAIQEDAKVMDLVIGSGP
jgi:N-acetylglutamate synthase-like GNAT family acetyltransferase